MKELSIEEKAKAYDKAIAHAKMLLKTIGNATLGNLVLKNEFKNMFPELAESENERIRKELIRAFKSFNTIKVWNGIERIKILAWLEKQGKQKPDISYDALREGITHFGITQYQIDNWLKKYVDVEKQSEQKHADKAEPKFKVGDWIVYKDTVWKVCNISLLNYYELLKINNEVSTRTIEDVDKTAHLWTFKDAKDGDVLVNNDACYIVLFKRFSYSEDGIDRFKSCCHCCEGVFSSIEYTGWCCNGFHPATKEQRDLLFQKMKEAGYEWDAEKKELKKIPNAFEECEIVHVEHGKYYYCIKDYYVGGNKRASKGDVVQALNGMSIMALGVKANEYFIPVNTIKQMSAWSEEDEKIWKELIEEVKDQIDSVPAPDCRYKEDEKVLKQLNKWLTWLKSIKDRVQLPLKQE